MSWRSISYGLGATTADYLNLISQYESGNQNIPNYKYGPGFTAQGYYQITNTNWRTYGPAAGVDISTYPNAMAAPQDVQAQVASYLLTQTPNGISNWGGNTKLLAALSAAGMQTAGTVTPDSGSMYAAAPAAVSAGGDGLLANLSGDAAAQPTADILSQLQTAGIDLTDPATLFFIALGLGAVVYALAD